MWIIGSQPISLHLNILPEAEIRMLTLSVRKQVTVCSCVHVEWHHILHSNPTCSCSQTVSHELVLMNRPVSAFRSRGMAARGGGGTPQRPNGIPREKVCQFKLVLLGESQEWCVHTCIYLNYRVLTSGKSNGKYVSDWTCGLTSSTCIYSISRFSPSIDGLNKYAFPWTVGWLYMYMYMYQTLNPLHIWCCDWCWGIHM